MSEPLYVPEFRKFTLREMLDHAPSPWIGIMGFLLSRFGLINSDQGQPAPNPLSEDLAPFEHLPEAHQEGVLKASQKLEKLGFERLTFMHNPKFPEVSGAYMLHQNRQMVAFVAVAKNPAPAGGKASLKEVFSLLGFTPDGHCFSVTTAPFLQVPHITRVHVRQGQPEGLLKLLERQVQGKTLRSFQSLSELEEAMDDMSMRSHRSLVQRGARKMLPPKPKTEEAPENEEN